MSKKKEETGYGVASIACLIISIFVLGIVFAPFAAVLGAIGCSKATTNKDQILSVIGLIGGIIFSVIMLLTFMAVSK